LILRPSDEVDPLFLGYASNGPEVAAQKSQLGQGSSVMHLYAHNLEQVVLLLPPLPEQKKIAAILSSVDDAIAATRKVIEQTEQVKKGLLQTLMTRGIGHTRFKKTEIGEIPEGWEVVPLEELITPPNPQARPPPGPPHRPRPGHPGLTMSPAPSSPWSKAPPSSTSSWSGKNMGYTRLHARLQTLKPLLQDLLTGRVRVTPHEFWPAIETGYLNQVAPPGRRAGGGAAAERGGRGDGGAGLPRPPLHPRQPRWLEVLRGQYSRSVPGQATKQTIRLVDFLEPANNRFVVASQVRVESQHPRIADLVVYVNGVPVVVIEAKRAGAGKLHSAYEQIRQYEEQIPRLFLSNAFNIVTDRHELRYGTTGAPWAYWGMWRDPWPRPAEELPGEFERGLWSLLEPSRLLDLLAHFIVFETDPGTGKTVKKMCRYQQYRAVRRIAERAYDPDRRRGLIWHTQGSGKSLTMVFAALRLKMHRTVAHPPVASPSLLIVTDRKDLDRQITNTFQACGLPNPRAMGSRDELQQTIHSGVAGLTVLSTIHKFEGSRRPVANSADWIVLVDEAHRTQEKDLGAFLRATFPHARLFGFTGTPVKKGDLDTYQNFSPPGEGYLDRYSIDDAVADGATVPIRYTSRKAEWQVDESRLDILFDTWFANEPEERLDAIKARG
jgi:hypothetical protein